MKKTFLGLSIITLSFTLLGSTGFMSSTRAEQSITPVQGYDKLLGSWEGKGMLMGSEASFEMEWSHILENQFIKLNFTNTRSLQNGQKAVFKAQGFYKIDDMGSVTGTWFDSRGITFPLKGTMDSKTLTILWGSPETEQGKTVYTMLSDTEIKVTDFILSNGNFAQFGEAEYTKK